MNILSHLDKYLKNEKKISLPSICLVCFAVSCTRQEKTTDQILNLKVNLNNPGPVSVFDLFQKVELIPLETNKNSLISAITNIEYYKGRYYIYDKRQHLIFIFDDKGKFLGHIGNRGNGPEEYHTITNFCIDREKDLVIALTISKTLYICNLDGTFVEKQPISIPVRSFINFIQFDNDKFLLYGWIDGEEDQLYLYSKTRDSAVNSFYKESIPIFAFAFNVFHEYDGVVYFSKPFSDGVYRVNESGVEPVYRWDYGKNAIDLDKYNLPKDQDERHDAVIEIMKQEQLPFYDNEQRQNDQYYYVEQIPSNVRKIRATRKIFFNKRTKKSFVFMKFSEGLPFTPFYWTNDYVIGSSNVEDIEHVSCEILDEENCRIFKNRKETDNPYLVKYIFKK